MGILNVTPDSFSDGGKYVGIECAREHALTMLGQGADLIDIGAESTRPGAKAVSDETQISRLIPVVNAVIDAVGSGPLLSVDTRNPAVAAAALAAGAVLVNDVSGASSPHMLPLVAEHDAGIVLMHMQGTPETMQQQPAYTDVVSEVRSYLMRRLDAALAAGVNEDRIVIDPGIGFGKNRRNNLALLGSLNKFTDLGFPVLLGTSRKRFMGAICEETVFTELVGATCATTALGVAAGVRIFRVHDVKENRQAADVAWACAEAALPN